MYYKSSYLISSWLFEQQPLSSGTNFIVLLSIYVQEYLYIYQILLKDTYFLPTHPWYTCLRFYGMWTFLGKKHFFMYLLKKKACVMLYCYCSVAKSCLTLCDSMGCSTPGFPILYCLSEFAHPHVHWGFPSDISGKEPTWQCRRQNRCRFYPWFGKTTWRRAWQSTPVFLPGEPPWIEEPSWIQSIGSQRVRHHWSNLEHRHAGPLSWWCYPSIISVTPSLTALSLSQHQGLFQWVGSSHQVPKVLQLQLQHQSSQWIFRIDFL